MTGNVLLGASSPPRRPCPGSEAWPGAASRDEGGKTAYMNHRAGPSQTLLGSKGQNSCVLGSQHHSGAIDPLAHIPVRRMQPQLPSIVSWTQGL